VTKSSLSVSLTSFLILPIESTSLIDWTGGILYPFFYSASVFAMAAFLVHFSASALNYSLHLLTPSTSYFSLGSSVTNDRNDNIRAHALFTPVNNAASSKYSSQTQQKFIDLLSRSPSILKAQAGQPSSRIRNDVQRLARSHSSAAP